MSTPRQSPRTHHLADALRGLRRHTERLALVLDGNITMRVWQPTLDRFRSQVEAMFEDVTVAELRPDDPRPPSPAPPAGRPLLVLTDAKHTYWQTHEAAALLRVWGDTAPVAIVNPYPQTHWYRTNLPATLLGLAAPTALAPNSTLRTRAEGRPRTAREKLGPGSVPIPLLELHSRWLSWWERLLQGTGTSWLDATVFLTTPDDETGTGRRIPRAWPPEDERLTPRDRVFNFRRSASAEAFRLATYAAAAPLDLSALRALQAGLMPDSLPLHLAEIVTSPLLINPGAAGDGTTTPELKFHDGVREALLACGTRDDSARVMEMLSVYYGEHRPAVQALFRGLESPDEVPDTPVTEETLPFAAVQVAVLRALAGPYASRARRLDQAIAEHRPAKADMTANPADPAGEPIDFVAGSEHTMSTPSSGGLPPRPAGSHLSDPRTFSAGVPSAMSFEAMRTGREATAHDTIWGNVPPRNGDFTGREELLIALDERLRSEGVTAVLPQALHGLGGVGKSQIAIEYAYRYGPRYDVVWWIPAEQPAQILRAMIELGGQLGLDIEKKTANTAVPAVREALQAGIPYQNWLLIFDNAETLDTVQPYLPTSGTGKVLITSRNASWSDLAQPLEIDVFSREESVALLRKRNPQLSIDEADRLAEVLDDLPLAVGQASAWRATTDTPIEDYLHLLSEKRAALAEQAAAEGYEIAVAAAWTVALDRLGVENPGALQLLQVCSFFAPEPIARELLIGPRNPQISPHLDETLQDPNKLNRAIRDLQRYGLARIDHRERQTLQLHRLVKTVVVSQLSKEDRKFLEHGAHVLLAGGNPGNPSDATQWPRYHALLPHVVASNAMECEDAWARQLVLDVIEFYYYWGDNVSCRDLARNVVEDWRARLGPNDRQTLKAARWLGFVQRMLGEFAEAATINADCLARLRERFGPSDEESLDAMNMVAADLRAAGDFASARALDEESFARCQAAFGPDDPATLISAHSLGVSMRLTGEFQAALELDWKTYQRRVEVLGANHPLALLTLNGWTLDLRERGAYIQAHQEQEWAYERFQRVLGEDHLYTLSAARNLAVARRRAGEHERGRKLAEDTLNRLRQRFEALQPDTIAAALNLAVDFRENDELDRSRELSERTFHEYEITLGPEHPYTLYARTNLAIVLRLLGQAQTAHDHNTSVFHLLGQLLGRDHVLTLTCATNLASDMAALGDHQSAHDLDADTLERTRVQLGAEHPSTLACALNLAFDRMALGRVDEGERLFVDVMTAYRRVLGDEHPVIVAAEARVRANCDVDPMPL